MGTRSNTCPISSIRSFRWVHDLSCTITRGVRQENPALAVSHVAMCFAWCSISPRLQEPGTIITGLTLPSSPVKRFVFNGLCSAFRFWPSDPGPKTIASYVLSDPVMWSSSTAGWLQRYDPSSAPPYTMHKIPRLTNARNPSSINGPMWALTGFILRTTTCNSTNSLCRISITGTREELPAPSTRATFPLRFLSLYSEA